jgi:hypothetical protein
LTQFDYFLLILIGDKMFVQKTTAIDLIKVIAAYQAAQAAQGV